jgi:5-methyltetrahydrofolate--homocysteine methyltransferase
MTPDEFAGYVGTVVDAGADFVGGCCGTTPEFVSAIARRVR